MTTLTGVTLEHRKSIAVLLAGILALTLLGFSGPVAVGRSGPSAPSAPQATCPAGGQCFADVPPGSPFYDYANNLYMQDIISGYACGGPGEPCDAQNRPYYRPGSSVTRAQMTKFVDLARTQPGIHIDTATHVQPLYSRTTAANGIGVTGVSSSTGSLSSGVLGAHEGAGSGVRGTSETGFGGEFISSNYRGAYVRGGPSWIALYADGWTYVNGNLDVTENAFVGGNLTVDGTCSGCTQAYGARNSGSESLSLGDLVAAAGVEVDPKSGQPVLLVRRAGAGDAVIGVAGKAMVRDTAGERANQPNQPLVATDGAAAPNAYVQVVVSGLAQVRVTTPDIKIGDALAPGAAGGAARAVAPGAFARAVSTPDAQGLVWALVSASY